MANLKDAIYGLAVADALGVPVEFKKRDTYEVKDMQEFGTHNQPKGTWSDDTSMTLATCCSIKQNNNIDVDDISSCFKKWLYKAEFTATGVVFDVGGTTSQALKNNCGLDDEYSNGNGSLMRIIPLAFVDGVKSSQISEVSRITHAHKVSCNACVLYVKIAKLLLQGENIMNAVKKVVLPFTYFSKLRTIDTLARDQIKSSGYVVDTIEAAIWCVATTNSYEQCVLKAVNLGDDTDTVAAVAGALAGIIYGYDAIPKKWIDVLKNKEEIERCLF